MPTAKTIYKRKSTGKVKKVIYKRKSTGKVEQDENRYVGRGVPRKIPPGRVLSHNHVTHGPDWPTGPNGFRAWTNAKRLPNFVLCPCGWAGLKHYALKDFVAEYRADPQAYKRLVEKAEREWGGVPLP
jgi:hypothetical protein